MFFSVNLAEAEVEAFLSNLATRRGVSASTENQALCSLLFLLKQVLGVELGWVDGVTRAQRPERVPVVLTREEVALVLERLQGREWLMASLLPGTGLRLTGSDRFPAAELAAGFGGRRSREEAASRNLGAEGGGESGRLKSAVMTEMLREQHQGRICQVHGEIGVFLHESFDLRGVGCVQLEHLEQPLPILLDKSVL